MALTRLGGANAISGIIPVANGGTGASSFAKGKIVQKVINRNTTAVNVTSDSTYVDTGVTASLPQVSTAVLPLTILTSVFIL